MQRNLGKLKSLLVTSRALAVLGCWAFLAATSSVATAQYAGNYQTGGSAMGAGGSIQQVAGTSSKTSKQKRPMNPAILHQPDSTEQLEIIHHRSQLMVTRAAISRIAIANPEIIDVVQYSPTEISVIGLQLGTTTLSFWFDKQADPLIYLVEIIRDPSFEDRLRADFGKLEKQLQILFPNSKVYLIPLQQRLIVKGQAKDEEDAAHILQIVRSAYFGEFGPSGYGGYGGGYGGGSGNLNGDNNGDDADDDDEFVVNMLEVPGNHQVMLHVKVAELKRNELRRLGVDIRGIIGNYAVGTGSLAAAAATGGAAAAGGAGNLAAGAAGATSALSGGGVTGILTKGQNTLLFNWLAVNHTGKVLAAPTLTVLSGHEASFLSGGEFPVQTTVGVGGGASTSTSAYRGYGTSVIVRPEVIDRDWIKMTITPEFSEIDQTLATSGGSPALTSRRVTTTVKLREGQTIVLAGLFGNTGSSNVARIPFFGELPLIGPTLFNGKIHSQGENELIITVTPELIRPMEPDEVPPYPGFYVTWPNDIELYQYAKTEGYPDQGVYQLNPYGWGPGNASEIGYRPFNAASFSSPFGTGGGSMGGGNGGLAGFGVGAMGGGYMAQPQPSQIYPGPPVSSGPQGGPAMAPTPAMQPSADPSMGGMVPSNGIQRVGYEQPAKSSFRMPFSRNNNPDAGNRNPATLSTNGTAPSLQNGNDGRIGPNGQRPVQPPRGRY